MHRLMILVSIVTILSSVSVAFAQTIPESLEFKRLRSGKTLQLRNCELVDGVRLFEVVERGSAIRPNIRLNRKESDLGARYKFFACAKDDEGAVALYAKQETDGDVTQFTFSLSDFPKRKGGLNQACPAGARRVGFGVLYKPSADAADARQGKPVVLLQGSNKNRESALSVFAANGKQICAFTYKASSIPGVNGGSDHYFAGWSGGCGRTGSQLAAAARAESGKSDIYIEWKGGQCLGPVNPTSRVGGIG